MQHEALKEHKGVRQRADEGWRRWFLNDWFDVILWFDREGGSCTGFQVCYARNTAEERAFSWYGKEQGHRFVQTGRGPHGLAGLGTAVLHGNAGPVPASLAPDLAAVRGDLPQEYLELICATIAAWNQRLDSAGPPEQGEAPDA